MPVWEAVAPLHLPFPSELAEMLLSDGWARVHSTVSAFPVVEQQQSSPAGIQQPCAKTFGYICFFVNTLLRTRGHPPQSVWINLHFPDKKEKNLETFLRKKPGIPSRSEPPSQLENCGE